MDDPNKNEVLSLSGKLGAFVRTLARSKEKLEELEKKKEGFEEEIRTQTIVVQFYEERIAEVREELVVRKAV